MGTVHPVLSQGRQCVQGATKCAVKGAHLVAGDKLCRGDKMCCNMYVWSISSPIDAASEHNCTKLAFYAFVYVTP